MTPLVDKLIYPTPGASSRSNTYHPSFIALHCDERVPRLCDFEYVQSLGVLLEKRVPDHPEGLRFCRSTPCLWGRCLWGC